MRYLLSLCFVLLSLPLWANTIEFISTETVEHLQSSFNKASIPTPQILTSQPEWNCKIYGMKSRIQTHNQKAFYRFSPTKSGMSNSGNHIIQSYVLAANKVIGQTKQLIDEIKIMPDGRLISKISVPGQPTTLAYSLCN